MKTTILFFFLLSAVLTFGQKLTEDIWLISEYGCNTTLFTGDDGLLVIDTGYRRSGAKTDSVISAISVLPIKYILNTHLHFDHVGGNKKLSGDGAVIVAHENTRKHMLAGWQVPEVQGLKYSPVPPYSAEFLPEICFTDSLKIFFNDDTVQAIHYPNAHSDCDVVYYFPEASILVAGDLVETNMFPIIDTWHGGTIAGYIGALDEMVKICNEKTIIIPGHGAPCNFGHLQEFRTMLAEAAERISKLIREGKTVDEVIAAGPTRGLGKWEKPYVPDILFIATVYEDLSKSTK